MKKCDIGLKGWCKMRLIDADAVVSEFEWLKSVANESSKSEIDEYLQRLL